MTSAESDSLMAIRVVATIMILSCHCLQAMNNDLAWVFNVGVEMFFLLSGFLYGMKGLQGNILTFYKKRIVRIYVPYVIWVLMALLLFVTFKVNNLTFGGVALQFLAVSNLPGLNHLWFIKVILFCYLLLPLVDIGIKKNPTLFPFYLWGVLIMFLCIYPHGYLFYLLAFFLGYFCGKYSRMCSVVTVISTVLLFIWLLIDSAIMCNLHEGGFMKQLFHLLFGCVLFFLIYAVFTKCSHFKLLMKVISWGGVMSYEIYLTHHLFCIGPLSLFNFMENRFTACMLVVLITLFLSAFIHILSDFVLKLRCFQIN